MDLIEQIQSKIKELEISVKKLRTTGSEFAEAEKEYKLAVTKEVISQKEKGTPATLIQLIVYGIPHIADLRYSRDIKEVIYEANKEAINSIKLQLRLLEGQVDREWSQAKRS